MTWRALAAAVAAVLAPSVQAFVIPPPAPLQIRFDTASGELTPEGRLAADRLAVRAARCGDGRLRVLLSHASGTPSAQVTARYGALRQRLSMLGVTAIYVNRFAERGEGVPAASARASVSSRDDPHCSRVDSPMLQRWAEQLALYARHPVGQVPQFWSRMSASVRRDELALVLAATSYCASARDLSRCAPHPETFDWLAERTAQLHAGDQRRRWVEILWSAADASTLSHWQRQLGIPALSPDAVLRWVPTLVASDQPWQEIERRLLMPGLMSRVGQEAVYGRFPFADDVVRGAAGRRQFDALRRLIDAAGEHTHGLHWEIVIAAANAGDDADFEQLMRLLPDDFPTSRWNERVTELLMTGAACPGAAPGPSERYVRIWERLRFSGFQPDREAFEAMTSPSSPGNQGACQIEAAPGEPYRFRHIRPGVPAGATVAVPASGDGGGGDVRRRKAWTSH